MKLEFFKMTAQGNDYIYLDFLEKKIPDLDFKHLSPVLCNRHFGVGADGIVVLLPSDDADLMMRIFNADGSEGKTCGSALRCITAFYADKYSQKSVKIKTLSGISSGKLLVSGSQPEISVTMANPRFISEKPILIEAVKGYHINVGNEHFVAFLEDITPELLHLKAPKIQISNKFTEPVNITFAKIVNQHELTLLFWERGSGATLACGSGTCAAVFAGIRLGLLTSSVIANVPGGKVEVHYTPTQMILSGKVRYVFSGELEI
ncbi:MAG: diaminopimelate epimerase [Candidatus Cloacimonetes bacterium]|nr:diaminopimelate epimerase [Candidatus Cloacimonadota bacterium]